MCKPYFYSIRVTDYFTPQRVSNILSLGASFESSSETIVFERCHAESVSFLQYILQNLVIVQGETHYHLR